MAKITYSQAENFIFRPNFSSIIVQQFSHIAQEDEVVWKEGKLMSANPDRTEIYSLAKRRYKTLSKYLDRYPNEPQILLVLAETHLWLSDYIGCLEHLRTLQNTLPSEHLANIIEIIEVYEEADSKDDESFHNEPLERDQRIYTFIHPEAIYEGVEFDSNKKLIEATGRWKALQIERTEKIAMGQFCRLACVSTNVLEGIFELEGQSWSRLVKRGFLANLIEGISQSSRIKKPTTIIRILENTLRSLTAITEVVRDPNQFTIDFIHSIHRELLSDDNIEDLDEEDGVVVSVLIPKGRFRSRGCRAYHHDHKEITQYCSPQNIAEEMKQYIDTCQQLLASNRINVFVKCAWIQWAFLRIHPYADGNGRISRIVSSIPLSMLGLPPIVITSKYKAKYFDALHKADRENDLLPLARFLRNSMLRAIEEIESLPDDETLNSGVSVGDGRTVRRPIKLAMKRSSSDSTNSSGSI